MHVMGSKRVVLCGIGGRGVGAADSKIGVAIAGLPGDAGLQVKRTVYGPRASDGLTHLSRRKVLMDDGQKRGSGEHDASPGPEDGIHVLILSLRVGEEKGSDDDLR